MSMISVLNNFPSITDAFLEQRRYLRCDNNQGKSLKLLLQRCDESLLIQSDAIILDESFGGLGLVVCTTEDVYLDQQCYVEIKGVGWIEAKIAWVTVLSDEFHKRVGIQFLSKT